LKQVAREELDSELNRTDIGDIDKNRICQDLMIKEAKRIAEAKNSKIVTSYVDTV
jgi:hypothetical protein